MNSIRNTERNTMPQPMRSLTIQGFGSSRASQEAVSPPRIQDAAYSVNVSLSQQDALFGLAASIQQFLTTMNGNSTQRPPTPQQDTPPSDIFGKVDTDRSGSLSKDELTAFAANLQKTTDVTLNISDASFSTVDQNGDGVLTPEEIDLRKMLSLNSPDLSSDPAQQDLRAALDKTWQQAQIGELQSGSNEQARKAPLLWQLKIYYPSAGISTRQVSMKV